MIKNISQKWRLLSGQNNWKGLLNPLDADLRRYILHYGARAQATYDTFNSEKTSKFAGTSRYARRNLFSRVGLEKGNPFKYEPVKYIYATSKIGVSESFIVKSLSDEAWCADSNWMGYVAVATDEGKLALGRRDILVAWRGTIELGEWVKDFDFPLVPASTIVGNAADDAKVHKGVLSIYTSDDPSSKFSNTSARDQVIAEVKKQVEQYKDEDISITITGHSLGAALSTLNAVDIVAHGHNIPSNQPNNPCPVTAFVFGCPRVGDSGFKENLESMNNLHILSVCNAPDIVQWLPPILEYAQVGVELMVDSRKSPYLNYPGDMKSWHNLEAAYLHGVGGIEGSGEGFGVEVERDIALVNKSSSALKEKYLVPSSWWCPLNKGMVQKNNGFWVLRDHEKDDGNGD
ncbi:phospholipase A1-IIgamma-like [Primulina tabacum]|uniref:phospholipase A1-IIgamma-like n=1 Tax=Primulina tabacum TaxID=48773 RepID=UPI003F59F755